MREIDFNSVFDSSNARYLNSEQLVNEFIWTDSFDSLLIQKNQMVFGSRGSGKTALIKMLSHANLSKLSTKHSKALKFISQKNFIATYVPLKVEWVSTLNNFDDENCSYFIWSLNLATCAYLLDTLKSCIFSYISDEIEKLRVERKISKEISRFWLNGKEEQNSFFDIKRELENIEYLKNISFNKSSMGLSLSETEKDIGSAFHASLFRPFSIVAKASSKYFGLSNDNPWVICIDEAEFLKKEHHQILNTHMRSASDLTFKITTMPYRHHTLDTNVKANINVGHDLSYVYIDKLGTSNQDTRSADNKIKLFAEQLFNNRLSTYGVLGQISFESVVGKSPLLEPMNEIIDDTELLKLITKHCSQNTVDRANKLYNLEDKTQFNDSIARKLRGALLLKEEWGKMSGNKSPTLYSGASLIARCSDGNPRRLFRIFNHLLSDMKFNENSPLIISPKAQSRKLMSFSFSELEVIKFETKGKDAFDTLIKIGNYLRDKMMNDKIGSDIHRSFKINEHIEDNIWENIKTAVDLGLLYPKIKKSQNVQILFPSKEGEFDIANCLSPYFYLLPRTGNSISLTTILNNPDYKKHQAQLGSKQMDFFDDGN